MIKIFVPQKKSKDKTNIRGFWLDKKHLYYDYLAIDEQPDNIGSIALTERLEHYRRELQQEAIFFVKDNMGYVYRHRFYFLQLPNRIYKQVKSLKKELKEALRKYGGATVYKVGSKYYMEIFY